MNNVNNNRKIDVRVVRTYNQLTDALFRLLAKKSFDEITVLEICTEAAVHRATFYKHFVDKFDFLNSCLQIKLSKLKLNTSDGEYSSSVMRQSCLIMIEQVFDFVEENILIIKGATSDKYSSSLNNTLVDGISNFINELVTGKKDISQKLGIQTQMLASYYAGAIVGLIKWWVMNKELCSKAEMLDFAKIKINDLCNYFDAILA